MKKATCNNYTGELITILPARTTPSKTFEEDVLRFPYILSPRELDEYVVLESSMYQKLFGRTKISSSKSKKRLSIVKVSYDGQSIHRAYLSASATGFQQKYVALTPNSIYELSDGKAVPAHSGVCISKGCWWHFYWEHPNAAVRMSFRVGVIGIIISVFLSLISILSSNLFNNF